MTNFPVTPGELVDTTWLNAIGSRLIWDSTAAGVTFPVASVTTPTIPTTFKHLLVLWEAQASESSGEYLGMRINGDTAAHYYGTRMYGSGTGASVVTDLTATSLKVGYLGDNTNTAYIGSGAIWLPNYADSGYVHLATCVNSAVLSAASGSMYVHVLMGGKLDSQAAISTLTFLDQGGGNLAAGARFSLYGMA